MKLVPHSLCIFLGLLSAMSSTLFLAPVDVRAEARVIDGDTIRIDRARIRLFGIDAPERGQPGAREATEHLRRLVGRERVQCEPVDYDRRNDRPVMLCSVRGGNLSLAMVRAGYAVVWCSFVRKLRPDMLGPMQGAEADAKKAKRGMWAKPLRPWRNWGC